jgi:hypothetical protein
MNELRCGYRLADGLCGAGIHISTGSYSGYEHDNPADWLHWASPAPYGPGGSTELFVTCAKCGKRPDDNPAHFRYHGHRFVADVSKLAALREERS